jgi:hypothetical protein
VYSWGGCRGAYKGHEADGEQEDGGGVEHWLCELVFGLCSEQIVFFHSFLHPFFSFYDVVLSVLLLSSCCTRVIQGLYSWYRFSLVRCRVWCCVCGEKSRVLSVGFIY